MGEQRALKKADHAWFPFSSSVFAIDANDGNTRAKLTINNATNCDWEDISVGVGPGGTPHIYIGDTGGNSS